MDTCKSNADMYMTIQKMLDIQNKLIQKGLILSASKNGSLRRTIALESITSCRELKGLLSDLCESLKLIADS